MTLARVVLRSACALMLGTTVGAQGPALNAISNTVTTQITQLEHQVEAAFQRADSAFLNNALGEDFRFRHATGRSDGKRDTVVNFSTAGNFVSRTLTAVEVEVHGGVAVTNGRIEVRSAAPRDYTVCYTRLYERRDGQWRLLSHRTFREAAGHSETCAPR
jgi:Domain of unknown function (DUF4440)